MAQMVHPDPEMQIRIRKVLNEDPSTVEEQVEHLKDWISKQPHLPPFDDDMRLTTFLRGCKFSKEKAKTKLDMYFSMRAAVPEFFANRDPLNPDIARVWDEVHIPPLSGLTKDGLRVVWMCGAQPELNITSVASCMKLVLMIGDLRMKMETVGVAGDVYVLDAAYANPVQFAKFTPALLKKFMIGAQEAYPVRLREVHVINVNPLVDTIVAFVKPFLKEKIRDRIHFHSKNLETLHKFIPQDIIPEEYGGKAGSLKSISAAWRQTVEAERQWFIDQEPIKADETRRPGKQRNYDELFGAEGSFRKLSID